MFTASPRGGLGDSGGSGSSGGEGGGEGGSNAAVALRSAHRSIVMNLSESCFSIQNGVAAADCRVDCSAIAAADFALHDWRAQAADILGAGLQRLEYRGYDSAGVAIIQKSEDSGAKQESKRQKSAAPKASSRTSRPPRGSSRTWATRWPPIPTPSLSLT